METWDLKCVAHGITMMKPAARKRKLQLTKTVTALPQTQWQKAPACLLQQAAESKRKRSCNLSQQNNPTAIGNLVSEDQLPSKQHISTLYHASLLGKNQDQAVLIKATNWICGSRVKQTTIALTKHPHFAKIPVCCQWCWALPSCRSGSECRFVL